MLVGDAVHATAATSPDRLAILHGDAAITYGVLDQRVEAVAAALRRAHPELGTPGDHTVALLLDDPGDFLAAFLGVVRAGGIAAPLSTSWSPAQVEAATEVAQPIDVIEERTLAGLEGSGAADPAPLVAPSDAPFYIGFTSGSTGAPRGVVRSHEAWVRSFQAMSAAFAIADGSRVLVPGSLFFSFSLIAALHALHTGGTVAVPDRDGPRGLLDAFEAGADVAHVLPSLLHEALLLASRRERRFTEVRRIICAGEALPTTTRALVAECCPAAALSEYYGASELGFVTHLEPADAADHPDSVGRVFPGSEVAILDEHGTALPPGEAGLLCARTPYGGLRYVVADETSDTDLDVALNHHGWRTVGDLAWADADGFVYLAGRRDRMVVIRGENVYPEETERVLTAQPGIARAAVVAQPLDRPTHLTALVQPSGATLNTSELLEACRGALPPRKRPRRIITVAEMPITSTGKIDYSALHAHLED